MPLVRPIASDFAAGWTDGGARALGGTQWFLKAKIKMIQAAHKKAAVTTNVNTVHLEQGSA
jgi:hypothetical protein